MKKLYLLLPILFLIYWSCEDKEEEKDTTPPSVTITFPQNNTTVFELVNITCISSDNEGVEKVELWLNGVSTGMTDETEPYSFTWNTSEVDDGNYTITIRSYDTNDNTTDSQPIVLTVDNTQSNPLSINITSLVFEDGGFNIIWYPSTDGDFSSYELEKSVESSMNDYIIVYSTDEVDDTNYVDIDVDPLVYLYYRITVIDTFGYQSKGEIFSSSLDPIPNPINVESVEYNLEEMTITWIESSDDDFKHYKLLQSETESGDSDTVVTITEKSTISHFITNFDPTHDNWFWVEVSDTLGQTSIGNGMTNSIDSEPSQIDVISVTYDFESMTVTWEQSSDNDFFSYELLNSESEDGEYTTIVLIDDIGDTSHSFINNMFYDPTQENWFKVEVTDFWNLTSIGSGMTNEIDSPPTQVDLYPIVYEDGSFIITWSQNNDDDFQSYTLYESMSEDMGGQTEIFNTNNNTDTSYTVTGVSENELRYYQIVITDLWGLQSSSIIQNGDSYKKIVFTHVSDNDGNGNTSHEIYLMNSDGSNLVNLTNTPDELEDETKFDISPNGEKIIFVLNPEDDIYIMDIDGQNRTNLTSDLGNRDEQEPKFSPDGEKIVFRSHIDGVSGSVEIYTMNIDGSNKLNLTNNSINDLYPSYSPDGQSIIFSSDGIGGYGDIYIMDSDGSNRVNLTNSDIVHESVPIFSPDGQKILFRSNEGNHNISVMDSDGSNRIQLTDSTGSDQDFMWFPDGETILFFSNMDGSYEIYTINVDGSGLTNLTSNSVSDYEPYVSSDGQRIVFVSNIDFNGFGQVYIMSSMGTEINRLTNFNDGPSYSPVFIP